MNLLSALGFSAFTLLKASPFRSPNQIKNLFFRGSATTRNLNDCPSLTETATAAVHIFIGSDLGDYDTAKKHAEQLISRVNEKYKKDLNIQIQVESWSPYKTVCNDIKQELETLRTGPAIHGQFNHLLTGCYRSGIVGKAYRTDATCTRNHCIAVSSGCSMKIGSPPSVKDAATFMHEMGHNLGLTHTPGNWMGPRGGPSELDSTSKCRGQRNINAALDNSKSKAWLSRGANPNPPRTQNRLVEEPQPTLGERCEDTRSDCGDYDESCSNSKFKKWFWFYCSRTCGMC